MARSSLLITLALLSTLLINVQSAPQSLEAIGASLVATALRAPSSTTTYPVIITLNDNAPKQQISDLIVSMMDSSSAQNNYKADFDGTLINGLAGEFTSTIIHAIEIAFPEDVQTIEPDEIVSINRFWRRPSSKRTATPSESPVTKQERVGNWGQARISQKKLNTSAPFVFPDRAGEGVDIFLLDTGVFPNHPDYNQTLVIPEKTFVLLEPPVDFSGHGTHTSGIIAGQIYGVAKKARIRMLKVLNRFGFGESSSVLLALEHATRAHLAKGPRAKTIINLSIGGPRSAATNAAINAAYAAGIFVVAAAGNNGTDACLNSPASATGAFVVGATNMDDTMPVWSNYGRCVNMFAPGEDIRSLWIPIPPQGAIPPPGWVEFPVVYLSGTSMAAPYVSGVAALIMSTVDYAPPSYVKSILNDMSLLRVIKGLPGNTGTPNRLLNIQGLVTNYYNRRSRIMNRWSRFLPKLIKSYEDLVKISAAIPTYKRGVVLTNSTAADNTGFAIALSASNGKVNEHAQVDDVDDSEEEDDGTDDIAADVSTTPIGTEISFGAPVGDVTF